MFEAIGFVPFFETKDLIIYENFPDNKKERIDVIFYLKNKKIRAYYVENDEDVFRRGKKDTTVMQKIRSSVHN